MNLRKSNSYRAKKKKDKREKSKYDKQLLEKGYCDLDVWNFYNWFIEKASPMLKELADNHMGFPTSLFEEYYELKKDELDIELESLYYSTEDEKIKMQQELAAEWCDERWTGILNRMVFLLDELDDDKCSKKNPYADEWWQYHLKFDEKYPDKDVLKSAEELKEEKKKKAYRMITPSADPDFGKEYDEISKKMVEAEREIFSYKDSCKNEFMDLFKKYFWSLWD